MYGVNITSVNTIRTASKPKSRYSKSGIISGRGGSIKKAIVTVAKGEVIDFYSSI
jgi:large subunit ribosomal protein L23